MPSPVTEHELLTARAELVALCSEFDAWLIHPGNASGDNDATIVRWQEAITLRARWYSSLLQGVRPTGEDPSSRPLPTERHLHVVES